jgi:hypothetical protein
MKYNYDDLLGSYKMVGQVKPTHCFDLLGLAAKAWKERGAKTLEAHYLVDGLLSRIKDIDGQEYEITIKPTKVKSK